MQTQNLKNIVLDILKKDKRIWNHEELNHTLLFNLIEQYDEKIIGTLFSEQTIREKFFLKIDKSHVFKAKEFCFFIEENKIDNSFTSLKNRIGLASGKKFLFDTNDIVLNWPYKDCILEGGQSTEEGMDYSFEYCEKNKNYNIKTSKRKEVFFNEVLAHEEIDRLLDEKAFTGWKRFNQNKTSDVKSIQRDDTGTIRENLVIKGNNLLVLHSLKSRYQGKIKLIYIDPPYNTGGDANNFTYNNTFNHSTWLTFMKNRLEAGKELLRNDGFIAIAIDHFELGYLIVLADEIFGRENRLGIISIVNNPMGRNQAKYFSTINDFMIVYAKNQAEAVFNNVVLNDDFLKTFDLEDEKGKYKLKNFIRTGGGDANLRINKKNFWYPLFVSPDLNEISVEKKNGFMEVYPVTSTGQERTWKLSKKSTKNILNDLKAKKENNRINIYEKYRIQKGQKVPTIWSDKKYNANHNGIRLLENIVGKKKFSFPKSLYTIIDTIKIMTKENDIILDFHAGSGTTGHAVLSVNKEEMTQRKFILVEQLDNHIEILNERLKKVLEKEEIKDSFIYCELAKLNEKAKEEINNCKTLNDLIKLFDNLYEKYFLNYNLKIKEFKEKVIFEKEFTELAIEDQKRIFTAMLDLNQLYVCKSEMSDKKYKISKKDQKLTSDFYEKQPIIK
ncbi:MAG: site-specific DNA-methyltransferase [Desulfobacteraceae bacterium]|nr:site-specific DNA-methyltransferase [Desulfobacteraceae bacterium]